MGKEIFKKKDVLLIREFFTQQPEFATSHFEIESFIFELEQHLAHMLEKCQGDDLKESSCVLATIQKHKEQSSHEYSKKLKQEIKEIVSIASLFQLMDHELEKSINKYNSIPRPGDMNSEYAHQALIYLNQVSYLTKKLESLKKRKKLESTTIVEHYVDLINTYYQFTLYLQQDGVYKKSS